MTERERINAALARTRADRPPVSFWRHVPGVVLTPPALDDAIRDRASFTPRPDQWMLFHQAALKQLSGRTDVT